MNVSEIKKKIKEYDFLCIGACHDDNIIQLKNKYKLYRTNPVVSKIEIGGVSNNIAKNLSLFSKNIKIFSLPLSKKQKKIINKNNIKYYNISDIINNNFYTAILNHNGKLILGLASNESYEKIKSIQFNKINKHINKKTCMILDLCFNKHVTQKIINYYSKKNVQIMVAGTSLFKIYRIRNSLKKIYSLCLNEDEALKLSNKTNIKDSISYILKKNPSIKLVITRGNKPVIMIINKIKYVGIVPKIKIKNENGAGDAFASMFFLCIKASFEAKIIISLSITLGCLNAMDYRFKNIIDYNNKFRYIYNKILVKKYDKKLY